MAVSHIPILRQGNPYKSFDQIEVCDHRNAVPLATLSLANAGLIRRDIGRLDEAAHPLRKLSVEELLALCSKAGNLFMNETLPLGEEGSQSPQEYIETLSATSALPHSLCRRNMDKIHQVFTRMETILRGLTRGLPLRVIDEGMGVQADVPVCYFAVTCSLGVVLPSNSPGVNSLWIPATPLKVPLVIKPGREEPWTPYRIIQAFIKAGCPPEAFSFYPADHDGAEVILTQTGRALVFGDETTTARYAGKASIQIHGPGRSKVLIGADVMEIWRGFLDILVSSVADNGGRSCINASTIVVPSDSERIADDLARRLASVQALPLDDPQACLAGFPNPAMAEAIHQMIEEGLRVEGAEDYTARYRPGSRLVKLKGTTYLLPTVIRCNTFDHPLANREFLFPYVSVVEVPQEKMLEQIGPSLVVTAVTRSPEFIQQLLACSRIDRLNIGPVPTSRVRWDQPHEGNLFEFLYRRRAIQVAGESETGQ